MVNMRASLLRYSAILMASLLLAAAVTEAQAGGLIEVRREPKFVYYNGFATTYTDIDHDSAEDAFSYGQGYLNVCSGGTAPLCYYHINLRPAPSGTTYNGKPYWYMSDLKTCQSGVCTTQAGVGMTITLKIANNVLCDGTNGWYARPLTPPDSQNRTLACTKNFVEDESTCRDPTIGNPLVPGLGVKYQAEVDYQFPSGPFAIARVYRSDRGWVDTATNFRLVSYAGAVAQMDTCSPGTYERKVSPTGPLQRVAYCFPAIGVALPEFDLQAPDGRLMRFAGSVSAPLPKPDINARLQSRNVNGNTEWVLVGEDNRITIFGSDGLPRSTTSADGRSVTFTYADAGASGGKVMTSVREWTGRQITFSYDGARRVTSANLPDGRTLAYAYDGSTSICSNGVCGNLTSVTYPDTSVRRFHYNEPLFNGGASSPRLLTGTTDELGVRHATFSYNSMGRAISTQYAGAVNSYTMSSSTGWARVTTPLGSVLDMSFSSMPTGQKLRYTSQPAGSGCGPSSSSITYDAQANVSSRTDFNNNNVCYAYDLSRNLETKRVEGLTSSAVCSTALSSPPTGARVISTQWHPDWRLETRIAEPKKLTTITYNGQGATCAPSSALVDGKPPAVICTRSEQATTDESGTSGFSASTTGTPRTWRYTYTTYGRVLTATDPNNRTTTYSYHPDNDADLGKRGNVAISPTRPITPPTSPTTTRTASRPGSSIRTVS